MPRLNDEKIIYLIRTPEMLPLRLRVLEFSMYWASPDHKLN